MVDNHQVLARVLGCDIGKLPTVHLGLALGAKNKVWKYGMV